ncbi:MAG: dephospho-CoA kinase [Chlamydiota bacterium]
MNRRVGEWANRGYIEASKSPIRRFALSPVRSKKGPLITVGLTGGYGTGKGTVAGMFARRGALVIDADKIAHEAIGPRRAAWREVVRAFGRAVLAPDGSIDRRALAGIVFADARLLARLNAIVHPRVAREIRRRLLRAAREGRRGVAVVNVPLLFETGMEKGFDTTVAVTCPRGEQVRRCRERDGLSRKEVERRIRMQWAMGEKIRRARHVIDNGGTRANTEKQVRELWAPLTGGDA